MSNNDNDEDIQDIECYGIGNPIFTDNDNKKFYLAYKTIDLEVMIGNCVRIKLEADEQSYSNQTTKSNISNNNDDQLSFAFGQVLAIYEDESEEMYIEVRWFNLESEIDLKQKKMMNLHENELVETDVIDDIPAGSVVEVIAIQGLSSDNNTHQTTNTSTTTSTSVSTSTIERIGSNIITNANYEYLCRYIQSSQLKALQKIAPHSIVQRGLSYSHYDYAYLEQLDTIISPNDSLTNSTADPFSMAIKQLHISVIPDNLPCRLNERTDIENYIRSGILGEIRTRPYYICGMPGTGKTATVLASIKYLREQVMKELLPNFSFIEINCLRLKSPADAYTMLWRGISGYTVSSVTALKNLSNYFNTNSLTTTASSTTATVIGQTRNHHHQHYQHTIPIQRHQTGGGGGDQRQPIVCLVDELDYLITRNFEVIYNFYSWPASATQTFILITIANTMDLPERLSTRVNSRSYGVDRLIFKPYSHEQIQEILEKRLGELSLQAFDQKIREFVARKAATVAGDLRAALKICQRTIEMYREVINKRTRPNQYLAKLNHQYSQDHPISSTLNSTDLVSKKEIMDMVKAAVDFYKETPFIATVSRTCQLDKAILIIMGKHRHAVSGGDSAVAEASLTCDQIWERLEEFIDKINNERYFMPAINIPLQDISTTITTATAITTTGVQTTMHSSTMTTNTSAISTTPVSSSSLPINLYQPPHSIFMEALQRLCRQGILLKGSSWRLLDGPRSVLYMIHESFSYSDLVAALKEDAMHKYVM